MKAAVLTNDQTVEYKNVPEPKAGPGQVLIRIHWASICGTDLHIYLGEFKGRVNYPAILGHEFSGVIEAVGQGVTNFAPGDRVVADPIYWCGTCPACLIGRNNVCSSLGLIGIDKDGAFAELVVADQGMVFKIPDNVDLRIAALSELYGLGVHSARRAQVEPADKVVVMGAGRLGLSVLEVMKQTAAAWVASVDVLPNRLEAAKNCGADFVINAREQDPAETILEMTDGQGVDRVIECIGTAQAVPGQDSPPQLAVHMARSAGRVVIMGLGAEQMPVLWKEIAFKELEVIGSRVTQGDFPRALDLMAQGVFHPEELITAEFDLAQTGEAFELLEEKPSDYIKALIKVS